MEVREPKRFVLLDFYRFIAALGVFIFHLKNIDKGISPVWNGSYGLFVDMFFILSGFVISYSYPATSTGLRTYVRFLVRRIARIYPLHLLTLLIFAVLALVGISGPTSHASWLDFLHNLLLVQAWGVTDHLSFNSPAWSISAELFCYVLFPLFMLLAGRVSPLMLAIIVALCYGILAHAHLPIWQERSQMYGATFDFGMLRALPSFLNGILLTVLFRLSSDYRRKPVAFAGIALFAGSVLILNLYAKPDLAIIVFSLAILVTATGESAFARFPGSDWLGRLGNTSYAIYMVHEVLLILLFKPAWHYFGLQPSMFPVFALVCCIILTVVADVTYHYVENPARKLINRLAPGDARSARIPKAEPLDLSETRQAANAS
ncbi:acyltransferase [Bradyrhizobium sp. 191]|uniref:acyltransferase family protein n=1 Tax=Bradyrhizobium sp. 191 TaxID=2782659 RepID=UPI00077E256A|nr:acyltransferase [Bradyrhizobium sp. 191]KYK48843.1 acyltransferase [Bradyrhizobium liaoningense]UPJ68020.1 acyltransferase [Bradyrhizobium sp. 191]